jgi:RNA polymerase sigma-70 factor (ECF subfamily)
LTRSNPGPKNAIVSAEARSSPSASSVEAPPVAAGGGGEAEWVRAARAGDREAFGRLVELHQDSVMTACHYLMGNPEDAADAAQDAFLRAWRSMSGFAGQSSFKTWLLVIAANAARSLSAHRRAKKRDAPILRLDGGSGDEPLDVPEPDDRSGPVELALRVERKEAIERAIAGLDEETRSLVVLRDLLGESYESIAAAHDLPLGTVKSRIHRGRLELREKLAKFL